MTAETIISEIETSRTVDGALETLEAHASALSLPIAELVIGLFVDDDQFGRLRSAIGWHSLDQSFVFGDGSDLTYDEIDECWVPTSNLEKLKAALVEVAARIALGSLTDLDREALEGEGLFASGAAVWFEGNSYTSLYGSRWNDEATVVI